MLLWNAVIAWSPWALIPSNARLYRCSCVYLNDVYLSRICILPLTLFTSSFEGPECLMQCGSYANGLMRPSLGNSTEKSACVWCMHPCLYSFWSEVDCFVQCRARVYKERVYMSWNGFTEQITFICLTHIAFSVEGTLRTHSLTNFQELYLATNYSLHFYSCVFCCFWSFHSPLFYLGNMKFLNIQQIFMGETNNTHVSVGFFLKITAFGVSL